MNDAAADGDTSRGVAILSPSCYQSAAVKTVVATYQEEKSWTVITGEMPLAAIPMRADLV
jgi:hypothetical protein